VEIKYVGPFGSVTVNGVERRRGESFEVSEHTAKVLLAKKKWEAVAPLEAVDEITEQQEDNRCP